MRESYQPLLWENQSAGRKRGYDEYDKPERAVGSGCSTLPSGPRRGAHAHPRGVPRQYRLPSQVCRCRLLNHPITKATARKKRARPRQYAFAVQQGLVTCWRAANGICSKRLVPYLPELVRVLEQYGELHLEAQAKERLLAPPSSDSRSPAAGRAQAR